MKEFQEKTEEQYGTTREVNSEGKSTSKLNSFNNKKEKVQDTEGVTATCFSSEAESKFKNKAASKTLSFISKQFDNSGGNSKFADLKARTIWTVVMLLIFFLFIAAGPFYCAILVLIIMSLIFSELIDLNRYKDRNMEIKGYYFVAWFFYANAMYYFNIPIFKERTSVFTKFAITDIIIKHHSIICFMMFCLGILLFLRFLVRGYMRYQFRSFAYIQIIALILGVTSSLIISNIFSGMLWFILPCGMVICNDIAAYIFGRLFGKTQLTELSPKKTVEGFVGALFSTIVYSCIITEFIVNSPIFRRSLCPLSEISFLVTQYQDCNISRFDSIQYSFYGFNITALQIDTFSIALFTSLIAPMGGFFASGFKRAIKIKDFSDTIPGHGGFTDRMDCQILVGIFTHLWLTNFVYADITKFNQILKLLGKLSNEDKQRILTHLTASLGLS